MLFASKHFLHKSNIILAACNARSTSQNGKNVPIASVPRAARPKAIHVVQPAFARLCSTVVSTSIVVFGVGLTATAVAVPVTLSLNVVEMRLLAIGAGIADAVAGAVSFSMNVAAMTRR